MLQRIVLIGPPAAGKGTQVERIREVFRLPAASTGRILREEMRRRTELGRRARESAGEGELVPDGIVVDVVRNWIDDQGGRFVLDGFPRTLGQARLLDLLLAERDSQVEAAIHLDIDFETVRRRILNRLVCTGDGHTLALGRDVDSVDAPCPKCGAGLERRSDDTPETLEERMREYRGKTRPVLGYYRDRGVLRPVDASGTVEDVFKRVQRVVEGG